MVLSSQPTESGDAILALRLRSELTVHFDKLNDRGVEPLGYQLSLDLGFRFQPRIGQRILVLKAGSDQYKTGRIAMLRRIKLSTKELDFGDYYINLRGKSISLKRHEFTLIK